MEDTFNDMDELIGKYLAGEATADEAAQVDAWADESVDNKKYVTHFKFIFEKAAIVKTLQQFDEDAAWNKMKIKLEARQTKTVDFDTYAQPTKRTIPLLWKIAASVLLAVGFGYYSYISYQGAALVNVVVVADANSISDTLPDGSDVFLNKKTKLSYVFDKRKKKHFVKLKGEAFFTIRHEAKKDFIIEVDGVYIRDIGTAFNIMAYPESNTIEVVVKEGIVEFFTDTDSGVYLRAGGKGVYNKLTKKFNIEQPETNVLSYKTKFFSFSNQNLERVVRDLNAVYDKRIILSNNLKRCHLTVTFNNEDIDEIANVIAETLGLSVTVENNHILLSGVGCE